MYVVNCLVCRITHLDIGVYQEFVNGRQDRYGAEPKFRQDVNRILSDVGLRISQSVLHPLRPHQTLPSKPQRKRDSQGKRRCALGEVFDFMGRDN